MNNLYYGREQSQAKHDILRRYLEPFAYKTLSTWPSIDFIDGFSGPWENNDSINLTDTSIGIALQTLSNVAEKLRHTKSDRRIRCIFNESEPKPYALLKDYLERTQSKFPLLKIQSFEGKFEDNALKVSQEANHSFQLLLVDPTGYTGFPPSSLAHFQDRSSEIIVNIMRSFMGRFLTGNHKDSEKGLVGLLGYERAQNLIANGLTIKAIENEYLCMLRDTLGYKFAGFSPIHNPDKNEIHFNLAFATNHVEGMEVMRKAEYAALSEHDRTRYKKSIKEEEPDLFSDMFNDMEIMGPYMRTRKEHLRIAENVLKSLIIENPKGLVFSKLAAIAQQSLYLKRSEIGDVIVNMAKNNLLKPSWLDRGGRKPNKDDLIIAPT